MVTCPTCGTRINSPVKTSSVLGDIRKDGSFSESTVGIYECGKCSSKFPHVLGRLKLEIIKSKELQKLHQDLDMAVSLNEKLTADNEKLSTESDDVKRQVELTALEGKVACLNSEVISLRKGMRIAEDEIDHGIYSRTLVS
ncbi:MAG: hypothetical protein V3U25_03860 [Nitrososphaerales archaeon]